MIGARRQLDRLPEEDNEFLPVDLADKVLVRLPWGKHSRFSLKATVRAVDPVGKWGGSTATYRVEFDEPVEQPTVFQQGDAAPAVPAGDEDRHQGETPFKNKTNSPRSHGTSAISGSLRTRRNQGCGRFGWNCHGHMITQD